jgi:hypothetical protein
MIPSDTKRLTSILPEQEKALGQGAALDFSLIS